MLKRNSIPMKLYLSALDGWVYTDGVKDQRELLRRTKEFLVQDLFLTNDITLPDLIDDLSGRFLSRGKNLGRNAGDWDIGKDLEILLREDMTPDKRGQIDYRMARGDAGRLRSRIIFNHRYDEPVACLEASAQLAIFLQNWREMDMTAEEVYAGVIDGSIDLGGAYDPGDPEDPETDPVLA